MAGGQLTGGQSISTLNAKGFGTITDLAVAAANDVGFAQLAQSRAGSMTVPKMKTLLGQAGDVLGQWGMTLETSRELIAVRTSVSSAQGGSVELLEHKAWDGGVLDAGWTLEQGWSPSTRGTALTSREEAPYLMRAVAVPGGGTRAVILDYGIRQADGTWKLASNAAVSYASAAQITGLAHASGTPDQGPGQASWRTEAIQFNPLANLGAANIGVRFTDGKVMDYTVQVTDQDGAFYVWARNLDRALQLQAKTGAAYAFNLRGFEVNLATLDEAGSTDDSRFRVELLTPAQFHFATSLGGIDFRPEMLSARRRVVAANDNDAWRGAAFRFVQREMAA